MARKKVNLAWIANDSTRRATFKKRKKGLIKKASELATLCDIKACVIVFGPQETQPEVWPSVPEATRVLARFKGMPEMDQCKKMMNQEGFLRQRLSKLQEQLRKYERENREHETKLLMHQCLAGRSLQHVGIEDATSLAWTLEMKAKQVQSRIERMRKEYAPPPPPPPAPAPTAPALVGAPKTRAAAPKIEISPMQAAMEALQRQNWLQEDENMEFGSGAHQDMVPSYLEHQNNPWFNGDPFFTMS